MIRLHDAIAWKWPGAHCIVRGDVLERWDGPMAQPSEQEIAQAAIDYAAIADQVTADAAAAAIVASPLALALLDVLSDAFALKPPAATDRLASTDAAKTIGSDRPALDDLRSRLHGRLRHHLASPKE